MHMKGNMDWITTEKKLPRVFAKVLTSTMNTSVFTPEGWSGEVPERWAYIKEPIRSESQQSISDWGKHTFGRVKDPALLVGRALEEFGELCSVLLPEETGRKVQELFDSIRARLRTPEGDKIQAEVASEMADVLVVLYQAAEDYGVDLLGAVDHKMEINRARKWRVKEDGIGQHE